MRGAWEVTVAVTIAPMAFAAPHTHPLRPWHDAALALAVAAQAFAVAHASPWLPLRWSVAASLAVALAAAHPIQARTVGLSLLSRCVAYGAALSLVGALLHAPPLYPRAEPAANALAAAFVLFAAQAPLMMSRWWVRSHPSQDAGLELAEPAGWSLVATALALTALNRAWAWSFERGTAWSTGACAALGAVALSWSWASQLIRRAWMRRVLADRDPVWQVIDAKEPAAAPPWTHAEAGGSLTLRLARRAPEAHYRDAAEGSVPVAKMGPREARAWWVRRALHVASAAWVAALMTVGASTLLHVTSALPPPSSDPEAEAMRLLTTGFVIAPSPCALRERATPSVRHRVFEFDADGRAEIWSSGRLLLSHESTRSSGTARSPRRHWFAERCVSPDVASVWLDHPRPSLMVARQAIHSLRASPREEAPVATGRAVCAAGRWCTLGWRDALDAESAAAGYGVELDARGRFTCFNGENETSAGMVPPRDAEGLLRAVRQLAELRGFARPHPTIFGYVRVGDDPAERSLNFAGADRIWEALRRRLCTAR